MKKIDWMSELRQWRKTRKAVKDAQDFRNNEVDRLNKLLGHSNFRAEGDGLDEYLCKAFANSIIYSEEEDKK